TPRQGPSGARSSEFANSRSNNAGDKGKLRPVAGKGWGDQLKSKARGKTFWLALGDSHRRRDRPINRSGCDFPPRVFSVAYAFLIEVSDSSQPPQTFSQEFKLMVQAAPLRIVTGQASGQPELRIVSAPAAPALRPPMNSTPPKNSSAGNEAAKVNGGSEE